MGELAEGDIDSAGDSAGGKLAGFANVEDGDMIGLGLAKLGELLRGDLRDVIELVAAFDPTGDPSVEISGHVVDADTREAKLRFANMLGVLADDDEFRIETADGAEDSRGPRCVLTGERDVERL